ncbi:UNVERIFIED_CONTAM: hypothetical protein HDU68_003873 [Siphonaria sp. JEL0065]|nr:hypothetical protein HDU68_003873 [Siphonaria sp. JEL0065]
MYGIPRPKDMRKDRVTNRSRDEKASNYPKKKKRVVPSNVGGGGVSTSNNTSTRSQRGSGGSSSTSTVTKSLVFSNGSEEYTEVLKRLNVSLDAASSTKLKSSVKQYLQSRISPSEFATSCVVPLAVETTNPLFDTAHSIDSEKLKFGAESSLGVHDNGGVFESSSSVSTLVAAAVEALKEHLIPEMAPPAEMRTRQNSAMELEGESQQQQQQSIHHQRSLRKRSSNSISDVKSDAEVTFMVPLDLLDEYSFWVFDELEKMGVELVDPLE